MSANPVQLSGMNLPPRTPSQEADGAGMSPAERARLKDAVADFEAIFVRQMLGAMRQTIPEPEEDGALFKQSQGEKVFREMLDSEYADVMSRRPNGLGIKEALLRSLIDNNPEGTAAVGEQLDQVESDNNSFNAAINRPIR